jgi:Arc/MetJ-type ribon-helix-helix transcriptional regulator
MRVELTKPELASFIDAQVKAGRFASADDAVEAAVAQMQSDLETSGLTEEDMDAIDESLSQIELGETIELETFARQMRTRYADDAR